MRLNYSIDPVQTANKSGFAIPSFIKEEKSENIDWVTVKSFGEEWTKFNYFDEKEIEIAGNQYFDIVDDKVINKDSNVLDVGCGTGRWTRYLCDKVGFVEAVDPSEAIFQAASLLKDKKNVRLSQASVDRIPFPDNSFDLVFSLGVLHHIPDTYGAVKKCVAKVKPGGWFLVYLYYSLDNRGAFFKILFFLSNLLRRVISKLPSGLKDFACDTLAIILYMPFVLVSRIFDKIPFTKKIVKYIPLSYYRDKSWNIIRNDSRDRFGTPLEQRFSKEQITRMLTEAGLTDIKFSNIEPYWHAIGRKI